MLTTSTSKIALGLLFLFGGTIVQAQNIFTEAGKNIEFKVEGEVTTSDGQSPLWLNANKYGLSSVKGDYGYLRAGISRPLSAADSTRNWRLGYGLDIAAPYNFTSSFVLQQLYADIQYKKVRLSIGSKERPANLKNAELSSGSQTLGINARPIPEMRFEIPEYISITGKSDWAAIKGHFGYGFMTDGGWQSDYVTPGTRYAKNALYHSKAGFLRIGNEEKFPLVFEGGLEMASQFGGTIYNIDELGYSKLEMGHGIKDFWNACFGGGSDATDGVYGNATGNTVGSWLFSLSYKWKDWKIRAYYDHFFEDHSMMFFEYGWLDGLVGVELTLPKNPIASSLVYEYINTTYQAGPIYHDHTEAIPDQISAVDDYYNHILYQGWQHWGQAIGNPLFTSPLYDNNGQLRFTGNRFKAHHFGISGDPVEGLHYRILYSYTSNWGTYNIPYPDVRYNNSLLCELNYQLDYLKGLNAKGWSVGAAFALDRGKQIGDNTGFQFTIRKTGLLTH